MPPSILMKSGRYPNLSEAHPNTVKVLPFAVSDPASRALLSEVLREIVQDTGVRKQASSTARLEQVFFGNGGNSSPPKSYFAE